MREAFLDALKFRHACHAFDTTRPVSRDDIEFVLEAGRLAPSSFGLEHWKFLVVESSALKSALQRAAFDQPQVGTASAIIVILARKSDLLPESDHVRQLLRSHAPSEADYHNILAVYSDFAQRTDLAAWSITQCHIAAADMMTAAAVIKVDSCPIGGFDAAKVREILEIDTARYDIALLLPLGYRKEPPPPKQRLPLAELVEYR